jgi:glucuronate isomerase
VLMISLSNKWRMNREEGLKEKKGKGNRENKKKWKGNRGSIKNIRNI